MQAANSLLQSPGWREPFLYALPAITPAGHGSWLWHFYLSSAKLCIMSWLRAKSRWLSQTDNKHHCCHDRGIGRTSEWEAKLHRGAWQNTAKLLLHKIKVIWWHASCYKLQRMCETSSATKRQTIAWNEQLLKCKYPYILALCICLSSQCTRQLVFNLVDKSKQTQICQTDSI